METLIILGHYFPDAALLPTVLDWVDWRDCDCGPVPLQITKTFLLGSLFTIGGAAIRVASYNAMGRHFTFQLSVLKEHKLITHGPYSIVRHPGYTGAITGLLGLAVALLSPESWLRESGFLEFASGRGLAVFWLAILVLLVARYPFRAAEEDRVMRGHFGKEWEEWARNVPYKLIPGIV